MFETLGIAEVLRIVFGGTFRSIIKTGIRVELRGMEIVVTLVGITLSVVSVLFFLHWN